jgi:dihydropteroate synthase
VSPQEPLIRIGARIFVGPGPFLVGILNVTPDSFSDGGWFLGSDAAIAHAERLAADGADIVDIGGESTRPGASAVSASDELARIVPVIERLRKEGFAVPISVDTSKPEVARVALQAGANMVNDVQGLSDPVLARVVAEADVPVVLMHMRGMPADMQSRAQYQDVVADVTAELREAISRAGRAGVDAERIIIDPGIGFAKTAEQSLTLLRRLGELRALGRPILVGPSRKSFIGRVTGAPVEDRLPGTLAVVTACVLAGAAFVRVHDVAEARQAAQVAAAIRDASVR